MNDRGGNQSPEGSNVGGVIVECDLAPEMEAFDQLPVDVRRFLNYMPFKQTVQTVDAALKTRKFPVGFLITRMSENIMKELDADRETVWKSKEHFPLLPLDKVMR